MKVSVIIPVYNVAKYIERCLLSVLNQTWQNLEIILVDDCSPDNSMEIAREVIVSHTRGEMVKCLAHEKNGGLSVARNTGISIATGDYLYFLDSDDYIPETSIELLATTASQKLPDFVIGNYEVTGAERWAPPLFLKTGFYDGNAMILSDYAHEKWYVMAWNKLVNRNYLLLNKLYFKEGIVHEDDLWSFKLACTSQSMAVVNTTTYYYCMQPDSIMRAPSLRNLECRVLVLGYIFEFIRENIDLRSNRQIYIFFETLKAKYFDRILYFSRDPKFHFQSYKVFREKKYISAMKALFCMHPGLKLTIRNLHYAFPIRVGYIYFKAFVRLSYYLLILPLKMKTMFHVK